MSEKSASQEKSDFKGKHNSFLAHTTNELGSFTLGGIASTLIGALGYTNPFLLIGSWLATWITTSYIGKRA